MNFNDYVSTVSNLSVVMSKFDVTRPCNFHKVLKNSVSGEQLSKEAFISLDDLKTTARG